MSTNGPDESGSRKEILEIKLSNYKTIKLYFAPKSGRLGVAAPWLTMRLRGAVGLPREAAAALGRDRLRRARPADRPRRIYNRILALGLASTTGWTSYNRTMGTVLGYRLRLGITPGVMEEPNIVRGRLDGTGHPRALDSTATDGLLLEK